MSDRSIIESIQRIAGTQLKDEVTLVSATVTSVDLNTRTCIVTPITGDAVSEIISVQLLASLTDGFLLVPSIGSVVIVAFTKRADPLILMFSDIDQMLAITASGTSIEINNTDAILTAGSSIIDLLSGKIAINGDKVVINNGNNGGLVLVSPLGNTLSDLTINLNALIFQMLIVCNTLGLVNYNQKLLPPFDQSLITNFNVSH